MTCADASTSPHVAVGVGMGAACESSRLCFKSALPFFFELGQFHVVMTVLTFQAICKTLKVPEN